MLGTILASIALALTLLKPSPVDWPHLYERVEPAITPLYYLYSPPPIEDLRSQLDFRAGIPRTTHWRQTCSLVTISVDPPILVTEEHCFFDAAPRLAGPSNFEVLGVWNELVAVRLTDDWIPARALEVRKREVKRGEEVLAVGFGWGATRPMMAVGKVAANSDPNLDARYGARLNERSGLPAIYMDLTQYGGMSGGAIVDKGGKLITLVRMTVTASHFGDYAATSIHPALFRNFVHRILYGVKGEAQN